jgi:hypothetical protein
MVLTGNRGKDMAKMGKQKSEEFHLAPLSTKAPQPM